MASRRASNKFSFRLNFKKDLVEIFRFSCKVFKSASGCFLQFIFQVLANIVSMARLHFYTVWPLLLQFVQGDSDHGLSR
jgi:hypothetical protein